jgi:hypothetical protein
MPAAIEAAGFFASFNLQLTHKRQKTNQKPAASRAGAAFQHRHTRRRQAF